MPEEIYKALWNASILGPIIIWFMWRDGKERARQIAAEEKRDGTIERLTEAINHLIRLTGLEVSSRPNISARTLEETRELLAAAERRKGG